MAESVHSSENLLEELDGGSDLVPLLDSTFPVADSCTIDGTEVQEDWQSPPIPALGKNDKYHVFISFSSLDSSWVHGLIGKLEANGLKVCYHGRDFVPGKLIVENMAESIQSSQKTLMVLSPHFVRSGWCLFEANLSLFKDCMDRKPIVPVMLKPCPIPLHLNHLTYLEAEDCHFFRKLLQVLCTSNQQMRHSTMIPYQPTALYNGKTLLTLTAVDKSIPNWQTGTFSDAPVPDQLRMLIEDPAIYQIAIQTINAVPPVTSCMRNSACRVILCILLVVLVPSVLILFVFASFYYDPSEHSLDLVLRLTRALPVLMISVILLPATFIIVYLWSKRTEKQKLLEMAQRTGEANTQVMSTSVLIGCESRLKLHFVYVSLEECKRTFEETFGNGSPSAEEMFRRALVYFSSGYACYVAKKHFPFSREAPGPGHLDHGTCFCQYVAIQLQHDSWA